MIPHSDFSRYSSPSSPIVFEPSKEITTPALKGSVLLTLGSLEVLKPKYSPLCNGIKLMGEESHGDYFRDLPQAFGFLLIAASPVLEPARIIGGIGGTLAGAVSTAVVGPAVLIEKTTRKILNSDQLNDPQLKRESLTNAFIKRMCRIINSSSAITNAEKNELLDRPQTLIAIAALALAFGSKDEFLSTLVLGDGQRLEKEQIQTLDKRFLDYFDKTLNLKRNIKNLSYNEDLTWELLMECLDDPTKTTTVNKWRREEQIKNYKELDKQAMELAESIFQDAEFQELWVIEKTKMHNKINNNNNNNNQ